jgi:hypothetical protein
LRPVVEAEGIRINVEVVTVMGFEYLHEEMGRGVLMKIVGEVAEPDPPPLGGRKNKSELATGGKRGHGALAGPQFRACALILRVHARHRQDMKRGEAVAVFSLDDVPQTEIVRGEVRPLAHAPVTFECRHDNSCSTCPVIARGIGRAEDPRNQAISKVRPGTVGKKWTCGLGEKRPLL